MREKAKDRTQAYRLGYFAVVYFTYGIGLLLLPIAIPLYVASLAFCLLFL